MEPLPTNSILIGTTGNGSFGDSGTFGFSNSFNNLIGLIKVSPRASDSLSDFLTSWIKL